MKLYEFVEKIEAMGDMESPGITGSKKTLNESLNEDIYDGEGPTVYVNNRKIIKINEEENWEDSNYFDDLDYYGPFLPKEKYIVGIKDENGNAMSYKELCDYLLADEDNVCILKYKKVPKK